MTKVEQTQVLIAGGGPVGLVAALRAAKRGLDVIVLERSFRGTPRGHTTLLHPSSMRLLAELGLALLLLRVGRLIDDLELRVDSNIRRLKLPFPALSITQALFEGTRLQVLRKEEVDLRVTCEVTAVLGDARADRQRAAPGLARNVRQQSAFSNCYLLLRIRFQATSGSSYRRFPSLRPLSLTCLDSSASRDAPSSSRWSDALISKRSSNR